MGKVVHLSAYKSTKAKQMERLRKELEDETSLNGSWVLVKKTPDMDYPGAWVCGSSDFEIECMLFWAYQQFTAGEDE